MFSDHAETAPQRNGTPTVCGVAAGGEEPNTISLHMPRPVVIRDGVSLVDRAITTLEGIEPHRSREIVRVLCQLEL